MTTDLAVRDGWVKEGTDEKEQTFVDWTKNDQRNVKSKYFCKSKWFYNHSSSWILQISRPLRVELNRNLYYFDLNCAD